MDDRLDPLRPALDKDAQAQLRDFMVQYAD
jgi:hypothetical protein